MSRTLGRAAFVGLFLILAFTTLTAVSQSATAAELQFRVTLDQQVSQEPVSGRLFVFLSAKDGGQPMRGPNWFSPEPFFGLDVRDFRPGESRVIDDRAYGFPSPLSQLIPGKYRVQALLDHDFYNPDHSQGVGNFYSDVAEVTLDPAQPKEVSLRLDQVISAPEFPKSRWVKEVEITSRLLSEFHNRRVIDRCAVVLPASYYDEPQRRYPVIFIIPGFSGSHRSGLQYAKEPPTPGEGETEFIRVMLSGRCKWGHHVYADSATNGPRGESLVRELIPHIDAEFRTAPEPTARFLNGHSSGGWSSLWLQVSYPETFGGVWSTSPDPVDFRDYQQVNLYADPPQSLYVDEQGQRRPIARRGDKVLLWYDSFGKMDDVLGRGGQLRSFEAVFSPLDDDGLPKKLWDRKTGRIDPEVAAAWRKYDIRLKLQRNWEQLRPKLAGKIHLVMGDLDTFYLEGAVFQLAGTLKEIGSDAEVEIIKGAGHSSVLTQELYARIRREMTATFKEHHAAAGE